LARNGRFLGRLGPIESRIDRLSVVTSWSSRHVDLSLVIPLYNEEPNAGDVTGRLIDALTINNLNYEIVLVDNGSHDNTGEVIDSLIESYGGSIVKVVVPINEGFGWGVIKGLEICQGDFVGFLCGDGQVDPYDVPRIYLAARKSPCGFAKGYRSARKSSSTRKILSVIYNKSFQMLYNLKVRDVNGMPKILSKDLLHRLAPTSKQSFFDAELLIKAKALGIEVAEIPVQDHERKAGRSAVNLTTIMAMLVDLVGFRFSDEFRKWKAMSAARQSIDRLAPP
jgi:glycosyltransferase involved in cell wall biosynthesis